MKRFFVILVLFLGSPTWAQNEFSFAERALFLQEYHLALSEFTPLARNGDTRAQIRLGEIYFLGLNGAPPNLVEARKWLQPPAQKGSAEAQFMLGHLFYFPNPPGTRNTTEGLKWLKKAAEQGFPEASAHLASIYDRGEGVPIDRKEAFVWYNKAANQDHVVSQMCLATMYEDGIGTTKNLVEAYKWYYLVARFSASVEDRDRAKRKRDHVCKSLSASELIAAKKAARVWRQDVYELR